MKPSRLLLTVTTLTLAFLFSVAVLTAHAAAAKAPPPVDPRKLIKSVDAKAGTIEIQYMRTKATQTYTLDDITAIKVNNSTAKISDIKVGMQVRDCVERDSHTLDSISVSIADAAPAAPAKK